MKCTQALCVSALLLLPTLLQAQINVPAAATGQFHHTPAEVVNHAAQIVGTYSPTQKLRLAIGLKPPHPEEEQRFLQALYTPGDPEYRHFLTAEEWNARFSPSEADEQAVVDWAQAQGLTITKRYPNRLIVDVAAPVGQIQRALGITINSYLLGGRTVFSNDRDPAVPDSISHIVTGVFGLDNIQVVRSHSNISNQQLDYPDYSEGPVVAPGAELRVDGDRAKLAAALAARKNRGLSPDINSSGFYEPTDLMQESAYNLLPLINLGHCCNPQSGGPAKETSIAILSFGSVKTSDILGFLQQYPYLALNFGIVNVDGTSTTADGEGTMDVEWANAMGNSFNDGDRTSQIILYEGANTKFTTMLDGYNAILTDNRTRIASTSWGGAEVLGATPDIMTSMNAVLDALAGQGWTLIGDADDKGSVADCKHETVNFPASSPNVIAAGGTRLILNADFTFQSEVAWTGGTAPGDCDQNNGGGGGGFSAFFAAPFYQAYLGKGTRVLPDLSLNASFPQAAFIDGKIVGAGGTSIVAPELAGFFAQENAYLLYLQSQIGPNCFGNHPCAPIGNANYPIYAEQRQQNAPHYPFYDITQGCALNDITFNNPNFTFYCAGPGYDMATGIGSLNMLQVAWAINYQAAGDFGPPTAAFSGVSVNGWYHQDQTVNMTFTDTTQTVRPATGIAGFSAGWDKDPAPESYFKATPGFGDAYYTGPQIKATKGSLKLADAGQGCHTVMAKAWDNTGTSSGVLSFGPICYDTLTPVSTARLSGTGSGNVFTSNVKVTLSAADQGSQGSGVAAISYSLDGAAFATYRAPFTVSAASSHTLRYFSKDVAGNIEQTKSTSFTIKATKATLASSLNPSTFGQNVTFTATITAPSGVTPTGTVTFLDGTTTLGTASLSGGKASFVAKSLQGGSHSITAVYSGNAASTTSAALIETVNKAKSTASITSSLNPSVFGKAVTFTAAIASSASGSPTGTVTFKNSGATIGTSPVDAKTHKASFTTSTLAVGGRPISASYGGDVNYAGSSSSTLTQTVNKGPTTTTLTSSSNPSKQGATVTFTALVGTSAPGSIAGTVTFLSGGKTIGTGTLNANTHKATFATSTLPVGTDSIVASYGGSPTLASSKSSPVSQVVK